MHAISGAYHWQVRMRTPSEPLPIVLGIRLPHPPMHDTDSCGSCLRFVVGGRRSGHARFPQGRLVIPEYDLDCPIPDGLCTPPFSGKPKVSLIVVPSATHLTTVDCRRFCLAAAHLPPTKAQVNPVTNRRREIASPASNAKPTLHWTAGLHCCGQRRGEDNIFVSFCRQDGK